MSTFSFPFRAKTISLLHLELNSIYTQPALCFALRCVVLRCIVLLCFALREFLLCLESLELF